MTTQLHSRVCARCTTQFESPRPNARLCFDCQANNFSEQGNHYCPHCERAFKKAADLSHHGFIAHGRIMNKPSIQKAEL